MVISAKEAAELAEVSPLFGVLEEHVDAAVWFWLIRRGSKERDVVVSCEQVLAGKEPREKNLALGAIRRMYSEAGWRVANTSGDEIRLTLPEKADEEETPQGPPLEGGGGTY